MAPVARMRSIVLDCPEPLRLAEFYGQLIGGTIKEDDEDWTTLTSPDGLRLCFQRAPGYQPPDWPHAEANSQQIHLDLEAGTTVEEIERAQESALALGAKPLDLDDDGGRRDFRVFADPAGHPFCLVRPAQSSGSD
jgi:hypothetical protein